MPGRGRVGPQISLVLLADGHTHVSTGKCYASNCVTVSWCGQCHGVDSVMVWTGLDHGGRTAHEHVTGALTCIS